MASRPAPAQHTAELAMRFTTTSDGVRLAYAVTGEGPPCIFCWGPGGSHTQLAWSIPSLREGNQRLSDGVRMYWFDWRGTGLSGAAEEGFTIEAGMRDLEAIAAVAGPERVAIFCGFGASMAAIPYAALNPGRVSRMVLWCTGVKPYSGERAGVRGAAWQKLVPDEPAVAAKVLARSLVGWQDESLRDWDRYYTGIDVEHLRRVSKQVSKLDVSEFVPRVTCPVLVIQGRDIPFPTLEQSAELAAALPLGELVVLKGSSYNMLGAEEDPVPAIVDFLKRDASRGNGQHPGHELPPGSEPLSAREHEVLVLIAAGKNNQDVAEKLGIALSTVNRHVVNIYAKAGVHNRAEATLWAARQGLVE